ncbi:maleylpyruvate isomerase N-terminal domain-containing protein [Rhizobium oryzicola]|uniref:Maleylpyruvate isomerase N-terminal domain-containing protein n=1 Tax=Rhizobium oryzicola TaxID=1232668 RepID=A0ABT8SWD4_9HYPH|nr:maleylpyruvate isomerase N-terminal domain-containing protein [Rhizobium oryzicola]MDO1582646.1 maleylpyruvate isomerase N-terminal domain-containing protein [Rhizobium oryzicola]
MSDALEEARRVLRDRQGGGARYDAPTAPATELQWARLGTAYFARLLNGLSDDALDEPSTVEGFSRRRLVALVCYQARLLGELVAWGRSGRTEPFPREATVTVNELDFGIIQPSRALRNLFEHTAIHLNVEWRDMSDADWQRAVRDAAGHEIRLGQTPLLRARTIWSAALALRCGARQTDVPSGLDLSLRLIDRFQSR